MMSEHSLKIWAEHFNAVASGQKTVELRKDDRGYAAGDVLILREWLPPDGDDWADYTGNEIRVKVTHVLDDEQWLQPGIVALSIRTEASQERLAALERLWAAAKKRKWEWYAEPRDEFEKALDALARMEGEV